MRILIILCRQTHMGSYHLPLGIGYVSACLKRAGHDVLCLNPNHSREPLDSLVVDAITLHRPELIALGGMAFHLGEIKGVASLARQRRPEARIMIGGPLVSNQPEVTLAAIPEADFGIIGEGEQTCVHLAAALANGIEPTSVDGLIFRTSGQPGLLLRTAPRAVEEDLDSLPWVDWEGLGLEIYAGLHLPGECVPGLILSRQTRVMPLLTSRGCPYSCTFCCHEATGRRYRQRSLDDVFKEIQYGILHFRINALFILDDLFCLERPRLEEFCDRIKPLQLRWECSLTAGQVDPEILQRMRESGCCCVSIGVESLSPRVLKSMKKRATREDFERVLPQIHAAGIALWSNLIFGDPAETMETVTESLEWFANHPEFLFRFALIGYHPGSRIYADAVKRGLIGEPAAYLLANQSEINGSRMSEQEFQDSHILINRFIRTFGNAGRLLEMKTNTEGIMEWRSACPYCGAEGIKFVPECKPCMIATHNCPECNRPYRLPVCVRPKAPMEVQEIVKETKQSETDGSPVSALESACHRILSKDPWNAYAWNLLSRLADFRGNKPMAAKILEECLLVDSFNPELFERMAVLLSQLGLAGPDRKYSRKAEQLRSVGVTATYFLNLTMPPEEQQALVERQHQTLSRSTSVSSFRCE